MAKANANGTTWYIPEGGVVPDYVPEGVTLVGEGAPEPEHKVSVVINTGNPELDEKLTAAVLKQIDRELKKEVSSSQPDTTSSTSTGKTKSS